MAKAKKLPSGAWRVQVYSHTEIVNGKEKRIYKSFTSDLKESAELMAAEFLLKKKTSRDPLHKNNMPLRSAIDNYIAANIGILSPTTINSYNKIKKFAFQELLDCNIYDITKNDVQLAISKESQRKTLRTGKILSPKTVKNEYGLISAVLRYYDIYFNVNLPKTPTKFIELPPAEIVLNIIRGTWIELPAILACWLSLSMSEIRGIKCSSIRNGTLYIENVLIDAETKNINKATGKADARIRKHRIPTYIMSLIKQEESYKQYKLSGEDNYLIQLTYAQIYSRFNRLMKRAGYDMSFHQLRHLNASVMLLLNVPEKYAMERGGWKTPHTMKRVYQHTFSSERERVDDAIDNFFEEIISE